MGINIYEDENVIVHSSVIHGYGVFAKKNFSVGDTDLIWDPTKLSKKELEKIPTYQKKYINTLHDGTPALMNVPERYVNHSDNPNTKMSKNKDIAIRNIQTGDE